MTIKQQAVADLLKRFPKSANLTLARILYKENPALFSTVDDARCSVRYARSAMGNDSRNKPGVMDRTRPLGKAGEVMPIPNGKKRIKNWQPVWLVDCKALVICDLHIPYHEPEPISIALEAGKSQGVDVVILNGDFLDCHAQSFWETDPRERKFSEELDTCRDTLLSIRNRFPKARIIYKFGNHEERYERYMWRKAPEMLGVEEFELDHLLTHRKGEKFIEGIEFVRDKMPIKLGDLTVLHGHEHRFAISNPVNPARGLFTRTLDYALCGHFHQWSNHSEKSVGDKIIATWSLGCLCDMRAWYAPYNKWSHGFAIVEVERDGTFNVQNRVIRKGKVY